MPISNPTCTDPRLGEFRATREEGRSLFGGRRRIWRNWQGRYRLAGREDDVILSLSGTERGPDPGLVGKTCAVLDNLDAITRRISRALAKRGSSAKPSDFVLGSIYDWDEVDEVLLVEYVPLRSGLLDDDLELYWPGDDWAIDHHIVLRQSDHGLRGR
ncbi:MAG: hypothetical protein AAF799_47300 [Myxococcota bacterium]